MEGLPQISSGQKFLVGKEKISRGIFGLAGFIALITGGIFAFPYMIQFATLGIEAGYKLAVLAAMLATAAAVFTIVTNKSIQNSVWAIYMGWVDAIALKVVKVNPVARVKAYVSHYLEPMMSRSQEILDRARGREKSAQVRLDEVRTQLGQTEARAKKLVELGSRDGGKTWFKQELQTQFSVQSAKHRTLNNAMVRLEKRLAFQKGCVSVLQNLQGVIAAYTEVTRFNVEMMVQEFESANEMAEGGREVRGMLGSSEQTKMYELASQHLMDQTNGMMAEVEGVLQAVQVKINEGKLDDSIAEDELIQTLTLRVEKMSEYAEGQRQLAASGDPVLLTKAKAGVEEGVLVPRQISAPASDPSNRFGRLLPPKG